MEEKRIKITKRQLEKIVGGGKSQDGVIKCPQCQNPISDYILMCLLVNPMRCPHCLLLLNIDREKIKKVLEDREKG